MNGRAVLEGFYGAFKNGDVQGALAFVHDDFVATYPEGMPMRGEWRGHQGLLKLLGEIHALWVDMSSKVDRFICEDDYVVVQVTTTGKIAGKEVVMPICEVYRVEDGKIKEVRPYFWDTAIVAASTG